MLKIGRRKRRRPTVGGRGETGKEAGVENWIFRDLSGLKIGRRKRRRTTVRGRGARDLSRDREDRDRRRDASDDDENSDDDHLA